MYEDIIDIKEAQTTSILYSRISFVTSLLSLGMVVCMYSYYALLREDISFTHMKSAVVLLICFTAIGLLATLISLKKAEPHSLTLWLGGIGHLIVGGFLVSVLF